MRSLTLAVVLVALAAASSVYGQTFNSGSTGADGALDLGAMNCATGPYSPPPGYPGGCWIQLPESGILNYTTINVPPGTSLNFTKNRANTPVVLLAQGNVVVYGTIGVDTVYVGADGRTDYSQPGPGGFPGGYPIGNAGLGPGGGTTTAPHGRWVGPLSLVPIVGGSGGTWTGGGGALVIASSGEIRIQAGGSITATSTYTSPSFGLGSGGAIRLVANRIFHAGGTSANGYGGNPGIVRLEAPTGCINYTGSSSPFPILSTINPAIVASASPELLIVSVGGFSVPANAGNRKDAADLVLPRQLPDPINVVVEASNIPLGSPVTVSFGTSNQGTAPSVPLTGSLEHSTATIGVSGLSRDALAYLYVQVLFAPPVLGPTPGDAADANQVTQVRMTSSPGTKPQFEFFRRDGAEVPVEKLPSSLKDWVSSVKSR